MYVLNQGIKADPHRQWSLPDRIFFGYGACHILAGVFLDQPPLPGFYAERVIPAEGFLGSHVYVTNGVIVFDYHGYSIRDRLLEHHRRVWSSQYAGWSSAIERVDFDLLSTADLNRRQMRGPDQYLHDAIPRARRFIEQRDHANAANKALATAQVRSMSFADFAVSAANVRQGPTAAAAGPPLQSPGRHRSAP